MIVQDIPIDQIKPYPDNPRIIPEYAVDEVVRSIRDAGFKNPIVVDKDYVIINGHTRRLAAIKLGWQTVPCHVASELSPEQVKKLRLADNRTGQHTSWDMGMLAAELTGLEDVPGFSVEDIAQITAQAVSEIADVTSITAPPPPTTAPDSPPEPAQPVQQPGPAEPPEQIEETPGMPRMIQIKLSIPYAHYGEIKQRFHAIIAEYEQPPPSTGIDHEQADTT